MGDVGHLSQSHQLNGDILVLLRHATADGGVGRGQHAHARTHGTAVAGVPNAVAGTVAGSGGGIQARMPVVVTLRRLHRPRVCKRMLPGMNEWKRRPLMLNAAGGRHGRIGAGRGHLRRRKQGQFLQRSGGNQDQ